MEELKKELEKLSKAYVDTPENEEEITGVTNERKAETAAGYPGFTMDKKQVCRFQQ